MCVHKSQRRQRQRRQRQQHLEWKVERLDDVQKVRERLLPQSRGEQEAIAGGAKWGCGMNEYESLPAVTLNCNLQRDGDDRFVVLPEGERGGGDVLVAGGAAIGGLALFRGTTPLMTEESHSCTSACDNHCKTKS